MSEFRPAILMAALLLAACTTNDGLSPAPEPGPGASAGAVLSAIDRLKPDTTEAALYDWKAAGTPHVGVWAADAAGCGRIDTDPAYAAFAVVTVKTLRQGAMNCAISVQPGTEPVAALCSDGARTTPREFLFQPRGDDGFAIADAATKDSSAFVRCRLP